MTFYEAAVEVLRSAGRPLHVKKITELSVAQSLLTHVGREPEKTMAARLTQEIAKASGETLISIVRPGVYSLREGADPSDAKQTIQLRQFDDETCDDNDAAQCDADSDNDHDHDDHNDETDTNGRKRRRRGRRSRHESTGEQESLSRDAIDDDNARIANDAKRDQRPAREERAPRHEQRTEQREERAPRHEQRTEQREERAPRHEQRTEQREERAPRHEQRTEQREERAPRHEQPRDERPRVVSPAGARLANERAKGPQALPEVAGDLADALARLMHERQSALSLEAIASALSSTAYADVPLLPIAALRSTMQLANKRRAAAGRPPLFKEGDHDVWGLATANDDALTDSYAALEAWQRQHNELLSQRLQRVIAARTDEQLLGVVALVMERLGYVGLERHEADGDELATFSARFPIGLSEERIAVRIFSTERPVARTDVMAFRGSLHQFGAARGILMALGGHDAAAREQTAVPNVAPIDLLHDGNLAELMIRTSVGIARMQIEASCLDDAFFA